MSSSRVASSASYSAVKNWRDHVAHNAKLRQLGWGLAGRARLVRVEHQEDRLNLREWRQMRRYTQLALFVRFQKFTMRLHNSIATSSASAAFTTTSSVRIAGTWVR